MIRTIGTIFSGIGGVEVGAMAAGLEPVFAIDNDEEICRVFTENIGGVCFWQDAQGVDMSMLPRCDVLWVSPPCQSWSNARSVNLPARDDEFVASRIEDYIRFLQPEVFVLENVPFYRSPKNHVFWDICRTLGEMGYLYHHALYEATLFGCPQSRRRLILCACRNMRLLPPLFTYNYPTPGWHEAIVDLIDELPESPFARYQIGRVPEDGDVLVDSQRNTTNRRLTIRKPTEPAFTICASHLRRLIRVRVDGVTRKLTARGAARLQMFPDSYKLPEKNRIAWKGIGNAVPPLMAQRILEAFL